MSRFFKFYFLSSGKWVLRQKGQMESELGYRRQNFNRLATVGLHLTIGYCSVTGVNVPRDVLNI